MRARPLILVAAIGLSTLLPLQPRAQDCGPPQAFSIALERFTAIEVAEIKRYLAAFTCAGPLTAREDQGERTVIEYQSGSQSARLYRNFRLMLEHMRVADGVVELTDDLSFLLAKGMPGGVTPPPSAPAAGPKPLLTPPAPVAGRRSLLIVVDDESGDTTPRSSRLAVRLRAATAEVLRNAGFVIHDPPGLDPGTRVKQPSPQVVEAAARVPGGSRALLLKILPVVSPAPGSEPLRLKLGISFSVHENGERRVLLTDFIETTVTRDCARQMACLMEEAGNVGRQLVTEKVTALIENLD